MSDKIKELEKQLEAARKEAAEGLWKTGYAKSTFSNGSIPRFYYKAADGKTIDACEGQVTVWSNFDQDRSRTYEPCSKEEFDAALEQFNQNISQLLNR